MNSQITNRETIREYLLGRLDAVDEIENRISDEIFSDERVAELVDSVEQEIIEEYEEGRLDPADRRSVEEYFLRSPDRQAELRFFRILRDHLASETTICADAEIETVHAGRESRRGAGIVFGVRHFGQRALIYGQAAALIAVCVAGGAYLSRARRHQDLLESELARERERSSNLNTEVARLGPAATSLTLAVERSRSGTGLPEVELSSSTRQINVEIALAGGGPRNTLNVRLETAAGAGPFWSAALQPILSDAGDARLLFALPADSLKTGTYSIVVSQQIAGQSLRRYYDFKVKVAK